MTLSGYIAKVVRKKASVDTKSFSDIRKLVGTENYNDWIDNLKIVYRQTGVIDFLLGEEELPIDLGEDASVEEYNEYILELAN